MIFGMAVVCSLALMMVQLRLLMRFLDKGPDRSDQIASLAISAISFVPAVMTVNGMLPEPYAFIWFVILGTAAATGLVTGLASQMTISERSRSGRWDRDRARTRRHR